MLSQAKVVEALSKARQMMQHGEWIRGSWARNAKHEHVEPWSEDACEWCKIGRAHV